MSIVRARRLFNFRILLGVAAVAFIVFLQVTTRGYVTDGLGQPVEGADVVLADSSIILASTRTDARGYFRFVHRPFDGSHGMLICARGHVAAYIRHPVSAIIRSQYGIGASLSKFRDTPHQLGWRAPVPQTCPTSSTTSPSGS